MSGTLDEGGAVVGLRTINLSIVRADPPPAPLGDFLRCHGVEQKFEQGWWLDSRCSHNALTLRSFYSFTEAADRASWVNQL